MIFTRKHPQGKVARRAFCVGSAHTNFALRSTIHSTNIRSQIMCLGSNMPDWRKKHGWLQMMSRWSAWSLCHAWILTKLVTYTKRKTPKPVSRLRSERDRHTHTHTDTHTDTHRTSSKFELTYTKGPSGKKELIFSMNDINKRVRNAIDDFDDKFEMDGDLETSKHLIAPKGLLCRGA